MTPTEVTLRPATAADLPAVAHVHLQARAAAVPAMPPGVHADDDVRAWVAGWDLSGQEVWVAESAEGAVVGYVRFTDTWLDDLYVLPTAQTQGIGSALFDLVTAQRPGGFCLWVFESNEPARRFYARRGCLELERTDGSANEEKAPDIRVAWPGTTPLAFLRALIDDVDDSLGDLLARRTALTRAVQGIKTGAGRDPEREAEIVRRVAANVPELGEERVARIMQAVISESLDAVQRPDHR